MRQRTVRISPLVAALLAVGCGIQPATPRWSSTTGPGDFGNAVSSRYRTMSALETAVPVKVARASSTARVTDVDASSVRDARWWDVTNAVDGNVHSAWSPADDDLAPTLTLDLAEETELHGLAIKLDQSPITFDVAVATDGDFQTIATGLKPQYQTLDFLALPACRARRVRLSFHGIGTTVGTANGEPLGARLFVCEARPMTTAPSPAPSVAPSPAVCTGLSSNPSFFFTHVKDGTAGHQFRFDVMFGAGKPMGTVTLTDAQGFPSVFQVTGAELTDFGNILAVSGEHVDGGVTTTLQLTAHVVSRTSTSFQALVIEDQLFVDGQRTEDLSFFETPGREPEIRGTFAACAPVPGGTPTPAGTVSLFGQLGAGFLDGPAAFAAFSGPTGLAVGADGHVYVADNLNDRVRAIAPNGRVTTFAGTGVEGFADGPAANAAFFRPEGLAFGADGNLYVADANNSRVRKIDLHDADRTASTLAGDGTFGFADGVGAAARFSGVTGVAVDNANNVFVSDFDNNRIRRIAPDGTVTTIAGSGALPTSTGPGETGYVDGPGASAKFNGPEGLAFDLQGRLLVADQLNHRIRMIRLDDPTHPVTTFAGDGTAGLRNSTDPLTAEFDHPSGLAVGADGTVYVADTGNGVVRTISPDGHVGTLAGLTGVGRYVAVDAAGHVWTTSGNQVQRLN